MEGEYPTVTINVHIRQFEKNPSDMDNIYVGFHGSNQANSTGVTSAGVNVGDCCLLFWERRDIPKFCEKVMELYRKGLERLEMEAGDGTSESV